MSSDKISTVQEPVLSLDMDVQSAGGRKTVAVELTKPQLDQLITSLDAANKVKLSAKKKILYDKFFSKVQDLSTFGKCNVATRKATFQFLYLFFMSDSLFLSKYNMYVLTLGKTVGIIYFQKWSQPLVKYCCYEYKLYQYMN